MKKNNLKEVSTIGRDSSKSDLYISSKDLKNVEGSLKTLGNSVNINVVGEELDVLEPEAVITPQDTATIKYLSNVIDNKTGEISKPFTIGTQKYQMVRGMGADKQIVMAVFAHSETDDNGENIIHSIEDFEKNIAIPMREKLELESMNEPNLLGQDIQMIPEKKIATEDTYEGYKHFLANKKTNEVRKFKNIKEMLACNKLDEEEYMGVREFKQYMNERLFGKRKKINELGNEPVDGQQQPSTDSVKPITYDENGIPQTINNQQVLPQVKMVVKQQLQKIKPSLDNIDVAKEKGQYILSQIAMLHVEPEYKNKLLTSIKNLIDDMAQQPQQQPQVAESRIITKKQLSESLKSNKVIKTIKVKDIKK